MTLVEIMVVIVIITMIASAVGVAVLHAKTTADERMTRADAAAIEGGVELWRTEHGPGCPTVAELVADRALRGHRRTTDAWHHAFVVACDGDDVTVTSPGHDGRLGTEDDVTSTPE